MGLLMTAAIGTAAYYLGKKTATSEEAATNGLRLNGLGAIDPTNLPCTYADGTTAPCRDALTANACPDGYVLNGPRDACLPAGSCGKGQWWGPGPDGIACQGIAMGGAAESLSPYPMSAAGSNPTKLPVGSPPAPKENIAGSSKLPYIVGGAIVIGLIALRARRAKATAPEYALGPDYPGRGLLMPTKLRKLRSAPRRRSSTPNRRKNSSTRSRRR